jgi:ubiquinone biosynthesis protein
MSSSQLPTRLPRIPWFSRAPLIARSHQIVTTLTRHGLGFLLTGLGEQRALPRHGLSEIFKRASHKQASQLRQALEELGPTFIKMGQALSARSDLLPGPYVDELNKLLDEVPPSPFADMKIVIERELGSPIEALFATFDPVPIASASIGQVYGAELKNGQQVVVKVVRPGAMESFERDLEILTDISNWASDHTAIGRHYNLPALVDEFAYTLRNEFDYLLEGRNADIFRKNFYDDPQIFIPRVYWDLTTRQVMTMERVHGIKINDLAALDEAGINRRVVAENLMHFALRQIFEFGLYHADPHSGNFFVQPDGSLAVMDFGMVGRLNPQIKKTLLGIAMAVQRSESTLLADEFLSAGIYTHGVDRRALVRDLDRLFEQFTSSSLSEISGVQVFKETMSVVLRHGLQLPSELLAMTRAITVAEGTGLVLYPGFDMFRFAAPYVTSFWAEERSPQKTMPRLGQAAVDSLELGIDFPRRVARLLEMLERGQLEVNVNLQVLREITAQMQKMTNRLALAMVLSAVIIALALVMVIYHPATWQAFGETIFSLAFVSSLAFGAWLMWSIIRSGRT